MTTAPPYLRFDALDDVTTAPALAEGGELSAVVAKLLLGENDEDTSESALPRFPKIPQTLKI